MDDMVKAILEQLRTADHGRHDARQHSTELFVTYTSNREPFTVKLPSEAAQVFIEEGSLVITTSKRYEEANQSHSKHQNTVKEKHQCLLIPCIERRMHFAKQKSNFQSLTIYHLCKDNPVGLFEKGVHDEPFNQIKKALK